jgi:hypothetical protein
MKRCEAKIKQMISYQHMTRVANAVPDDMAQRALEEKTDVIFWKGAIPDDALPN